MARICPEKGLHLLVEAFRELVRRCGPRAVHLEVAGYLGPRDAEYFEEPMQLFTAAPKSFAEGEYLPFKLTTSPPPAVHVSAGAPTRIHLETPQAGAGVSLPLVGGADDSPGDSEGGED